MPDLPGLKHERLNARPRNRICWILKYQGPIWKAFIHTMHFLGENRQLVYMITGGNLSMQRNEGHKVHIQDKMHIWLLVTIYVEAKSQIYRYISLSCIMYILMLLCLLWPSCLHQYFLLNKYTSIYLWNSELYGLLLPACFTTGNLW